MYEGKKQVQNAQTEQKKKHRANRILGGIWLSRHFGFGFVRCLVVSQSGFPGLLRLRDLKSILIIQFL